MAKRWKDVWEANRRNLKDAQDQSASWQLLRPGFSRHIELRFDVYAVIDASGTWVQEVAVARMAQACIIPIPWVAVGAELQEDSRNATGQELGATMGEHLPFYGNLYGSWQRSVQAKPRNPVVNRATASPASDWGWWELNL